MRPQILPPPFFLNFDSGWTELGTNYAARGVPARTRLESGADLGRRFKRRPQGRGEGRGGEGPPNIFSLSWILYYSLGTLPLALVPHPFELINLELKESPSTFSLDFLLTQGEEPRNFQTSRLRLPGGTKGKELKKSSLLL